MGGRGGMLVVSRVDGVIVEKVELCRKWVVGACYRTSSSQSCPAKG